MKKEAILAEKSGDELVKEYQLKMKHLDTDTAPASSSPLSFIEIQVLSYFQFCSHLSSCMQVQFLRMNIAGEHINFNDTTSESL